MLPIMRTYSPDKIEPTIRTADRHNFSLTGPVSATLTAKWPLTALAVTCTSPVFVNLMALPTRFRPGLDLGDVEYRVDEAEEVLAVGANACEGVQRLLTEGLIAAPGHGDGLRMLLCMRFAAGPTRVARLPFALAGCAQLLYEARLLKL